VKIYFLRTILLLLTIIVLFGACANIDVFEKNVAFNNRVWAGKQPQSIQFTVTDTTALYKIYLVFRHTDSYGFNNLWLTITRKGPDTTYSEKVDIPLANNEQGWLGTGMDDIWEHRILLTSKPVVFRRKGDYQFQLEHIMRQEPLEQVMNIGLRVEKVQP
jgi:gliding motility-associated lipoprotein GldH